MRRAGFTRGLTVLLGVALAAAPLVPGAAAPAPHGDRSSVEAPSAGSAPAPAEHSSRQAKKAKPSVTKLTPQAGSASGGFDVVIKGRGLSSVKRVLFGTTKAADVQVKSDRKLVVEAPAHAPGQVELVVLTKQGKSKVTKATQFTYNAPPPTLTFLDPTSGPTTGGTTVTVTGSDFTKVTGVTFGGAAGSGVTVISAKQLRVTAPAHAPGAVDVVVTTATGTSPVTGAARYTYVTPPPSVTQVSPREGPTTGGTTVTLTGSQLAGASAVRFGGTNATSFNVVSSTTITATAPARSAGVVNVSVVTPVGTASLDDGFTYVPAPTLYYVDPGSGPMQETPVTLVGTDLTEDSVVTFDGTPGTFLSVTPDGTELIVWTPAHAEGWVDVEVTTVGGSDTLLNGYRFVGGPTLTSVAPSAGPMAGGITVTLTGSGFTGDTLVTFDNKPSPSATVFANEDGTELTALLPARTSPGLVDVFVATEGGSASLDDAFTYVAAPTLTSVTPTEGPVTGGTSVALTGTNFRAGMEVSFGGAAATGLVVNSPTSATVTAPGHAAGLVGVSVTTPGGTATLPGAFTYVAAPTLTAVAPNEGPTVGGQTVTLTGTNFRAGMQVSFGTAAATGLIIDSTTSARVVTPSNAVGPVTVSVTTPGGAGTLPNGYTYVVAPVLTSLAPDNGPIGGGTTVTLTGSGFRAGMEVRFGGTLAALVSVDSGGTSATVITPAHAAGPVSVIVTTPGGPATLTNGFTYVANPTLTALSPNEGPTAGNQTVTLTGSGFRAGMQVRFGGVLGTGLNVIDDGQATVITPPHGAGVVDVSLSTTGGPATLPGGYTYVAEPTLATVSPDEGPTGGGQSVTLTGTGFRDGMTVTIGGAAATGLDVVSGTEATAFTPSGTAGEVDVVVVTPGGADTLGFGYTYVAAPTIGSISPDEGPIIGGQQVTVTGTNLIGATSVTFDGVAGVIDSKTPTTINVTTPAGAEGVADVVVTTPGGDATATGGYTYVAPPTVTLVTPDSGPTTGDTTVTITGTGLLTAYNVTFDGLQATYTVDSDTQITAVTPPGGALGQVDVAVTTPGGTGTLPGGFTYTP